MFDSNMTAKVMTRFMCNSRSFCTEGGAKFMWRVCEAEPSSGSLH